MLNISLNSDVRKQWHLYRLKTMAFVFVFLFLICKLSYVYADSSLNGPTGLVNIPSAYVNGTKIGYHSIGKSGFYKLNTSFFNNAVEFGYIREKDQSVSSYNLKVPVLEEDQYTPQIAVGAYNYKSSAVSQTNYIVVSKYLDSFGVTAHIGYINSGGLKDATKLINYRTITDAVNDINSNNSKTFWGLEYSFFPMFSVMTEGQNGIMNGGVRFRPLPALTIDYDLLDLKNKNNLERKRIFNVNYNIGF